MSLVEFHNVSKSFDDEVVLENIDLAVEEGDLAVLYGSPGTGKSVLLRTLLGLEAPDSGSISIRGVDASSIKPGDRNIGYVPQSFALFPNKTVRKNISYPLGLAGLRSEETKQPVEKMAELLGIHHLLDRTPDKLSGGQKQRVAIARGLVRQTEVYVLDDPLVGLDFKLREQLVDDLRATQEALGATFFYATSDASEALALASKVGVLANGRIVEYGNPLDLYHNPQLLETMTSLCFPAANLIAGQIESTGSQHVFASQFGRVYADISDHNFQSNTVIAAARPEYISYHPVHVPALSGPATVELREDLGAEEIVYLQAGGHTFTAVVRADVDDATSLEIQQEVSLSIPAEHIVLFADGRRIGQGVANARDVSSQGTSAGHRS